MNVDDVVIGILKGSSAMTAAYLYKCHLMLVWKPLSKDFIP